MAIKLAIVLTRPEENYFQNKKGEFITSYHEQVKDKASRVLMP